MVNNQEYREVKAKLTVQLDTCDDFVVEKIYKLTDTNDPCGSLELISETITNEGNGLPGAGIKDYKVNIDSSSINQVAALSANGTNILNGTVYSWPGQLADLEDAIQQYLDVNGGGTANMYASNSGLLIVIQDCPDVAFNTITTNVGTENFELLGPSNG